jgi:flavin-dependent dehydrogenase
MGLSVGPHAGRNVLVTGDAAGAINPFNGEGIAYGYETGRLAASIVATALRDGDASALEGYGPTLMASYGDYFRVARGFVQLISEPAVMQACVRAGMHSNWLMRQLLSIMANLLRPDDLGAAEVAYRALDAVARHVPDGVLDALFSSVAQHTASAATS